MKEKENNTSTTGIEFTGFGDAVMWATANLRWSKDGVLQQMWRGMNGEEKWFSIAEENVGE